MLTDDARAGGAPERSERIHDGLIDNVNIRVRFFPKNEYVNCSEAMLESDHLGEHAFREDLVDPLSEFIGSVLIRFGGPFTVLQLPPYNEFLTRKVILGRLSIHDVSQCVC